MPEPEHTTTDIYLAAYLWHRGAVFRGLKRTGPKTCVFRFTATAELHDLLRLSWRSSLTPVVPQELFAALHRLRCQSITRPK